MGADSCTQVMRVKKETETCAGLGSQWNRPNTCLLPLRRHTPGVSAAAKLLCVPRLEGGSCLRSGQKQVFQQDYWWERLQHEALMQHARGKRHRLSSHLTLQRALQLEFLLFYCPQPVLLSLPVQVLPPQSHLAAKLQPHKKHTMLSWCLYCWHVWEWEMSATSSRLIPLTILFRWFVRVFCEHFLWDETKRQGNNRLWCSDSL